MRRSRWFLWMMLLTVAMSPGSLGGDTAPERPAR